MKWICKSQLKSWDRWSHIWSTEPLWPTKCFLILLKPCCQSERGRGSQRSFDDAYKSISCLRSQRVLLTSWAASVRSYTINTSSNIILLVGICISFSSTAITMCSLNCLIHPLAWRTVLQWFEFASTASQGNHLLCAFSPSFAYSLSSSAPPVSTHPGSQVADRSSRADVGEVLQGGHCDKGSKEKRVPFLPHLGPDKN